MLRFLSIRIILVLFLFSVTGGLMFSACGGGGDDDDDESPWNPPAAAIDWNRDIVDTGLVIDMTALSGKATITLASSTSTAASFEAGGLVIDGVSTSGGALNYTVTDGRLDVGVPSNGSDATIVIDYRFSLQSDYDGWLASNVTFIWPYYCGNLFPCHSDPADGLTFSLQLQNIPGSQGAVYPATISTAAPSYQIAWALGAYTELSLGTTSAGTDISVWILPGMEDKASGWQDLTAVFDQYERLLGPYPFGNKAGTVGVVWGQGGYGGMEHHPYWHIGKPSLSDAPTHTHEAGHGWYGDGIRIECWEDFVLSEGTVTYLTARVTELALGAEAGAEVWSGYESELAWILEHGDGIAWPDSCGEVDILEDGLFSLVPYIKGAYFYKAVAAVIGETALDDVLHSFFLENVGTAARMQDMLDHIMSETGFDASGLAEGWLRSYGCPDEAVTRTLQERTSPAVPIPLDMRTFMLMERNAHM